MNKCRFPLVAELRNVCWFEGRGEIECTLPPGAYTLSWRIRFLDNFVGWADEPAHFKFSKNNGTEMEFKCYIQQQLPPVQVPGYSSPTIRQVEDEWKELDAGEFVVERGEEMTLLQFCMLEITGGRWKRGLRLDGVLVRPTNTLAPSLPSSPATNAAQLTRLLPRHLPHNRRFPMDLPGTFQLARTWSGTPPPTTTTLADCPMNGSSPDGKFKPAPTISFSFQSNGSEVPYGKFKLQISVDKFSGWF